MASPSTLYIIPGGQAELKGKMFRASPPFAPVAPLGDGFLDFFREKGIEVRTIDEWDPANHSPSDAFVVINHPDDSWFWNILFFLKYTLRGRKQYAMSRAEFKRACRMFSKKILYQVEPPTNMPYPHRHLRKFLRIYDRIFVHVKNGVHDPHISYVMWPQGWRPEFEDFFKVPKKKFLIMMNNNARPHAFFSSRELYSERLRVIKFFNGVAGFDFYGGRWDKRPYFPHWHYDHYIRKCWRGKVDGDKVQTFASYKFSISFENSKFPGYVSEKIFDSFFAGCIPVYLGAPDITDYVPADCFIDMRNFRNYDELEKHLRSITEEECAAYRERIRAYLYSEKDGIFSKRKFAEIVWDALQEIK